MRCPDDSRRRELGLLRLTPETVRCPSCSAPASHRTGDETRSRAPSPEVYSRKAEADGAKGLDEVEVVPGQSVGIRGRLYSDVARASHAEGVAALAALASAERAPGLVCLRQTDQTVPDAYCGFRLMEIVTYCNQHLNVPLTVP